MKKEVVPVGELLERVQDYLEQGYTFPVVHTAVDHGESLELIYVLRDLENPGREERILSVQISSDNPTLPSLTPLIPGLIFQEREVYDLFGVTYQGHPDLRRLLLPDDFSGHPLRKHYTATEGGIVG
ncbi:MAG: NADH-quinone oxidoreductase subunit C [Firmicutes bacterium]|jgi:NADH-quinone oxidoreductase subunit C|uniref:NADH-quinone oxidoreductase n=1 Tax=Sulfobacillus benefaciens TaxID=453960 RepID=A0A2T2X0Y9_9FIRM|nr:NADH-quinone oxidoreductase subunit C [Bacillota bacterium]PSR28138.1 MAG: NADH-quinone oxidoreductase subunit C [Sulfobacillus benefaciens]HBQ96859.1 NADH-quinone oxidoreductase subunit C [Sulfobacillus sp.]